MSIFQTLEQSDEAFVGISKEHSLTKTYLAVQREEKTRTQVND